MKQFQLQYNQINFFVILFFLIFVQIGEQIDYSQVKIFHILFFEKFHFHLKNFFFFYFFNAKVFLEIIKLKSLISKSSNVVETKPDNNSSIILLSKFSLIVSGFIPDLFK